MKQITLEYIVSQLEMMGSLIVLNLKAPVEMSMIPSPMDGVSETMPSEEEVKRMLSKLKPNSKGSDEEIVVNKFVDAYVNAIKDKMPGLLEGIKGVRGDRGGMVSSEAPIYDTILYLTQEQYKALGSPPLLAKLKVKVGMVK